MKKIYLILALILIINAPIYAEIKILDEVSTYDCEYNPNRGHLIHFSENLLTWSGKGFFERKADQANGDILQIRTNGKEYLEILPPENTSEYSSLYPHRTLKLEYEFREIIIRLIPNESSVISPFSKLDFSAATRPIPFDTSRKILVYLKKKSEEKNWNIEMASAMIEWLFSVKKNQYEWIPNIKIKYPIPGLGYYVINNVIYQPKFERLSLEMELLNNQNKKIEVDERLKFAITYNQKVISMDTFAENDIIITHMKGVKNPLEILKSKELALNALFTGNYENK